jgi:hypothetical protein
VYGAHVPGAPVTLSSCPRIVREEGLRPSAPWRAMREPHRPRVNEPPAPLACDPWLCDCRETRLEQVKVEP